MEATICAPACRLSWLMLALTLWMSWPAAEAAAQPRRPSRSVAHSLEGLWTSSSLTMMERPTEFRTLTVSDREARVFEIGRNKRLEGASDEVGSLESEVQTWDKDRRLARIAGQARTSWLVDPTDGHLPYSPAGKATVAAERKRMASMDNPESGHPSGRCLQATWGQAAPPMMNGPYSNLYQIVETADAVVISLEDNHEARIVRLRETQHLPANIHPWMGDSIGHWEGRTLVVETTNFNSGDAVKGQANVFISEGATVTERFTRTGAGELLYQFEVADPAIYTRPWRGEMAYVTAKGPMYEFACHEGNYSLPGILAGARHDELPR